MVSTVSTPFFRQTGADRLRLRTLILLRWMAIAGQIAAILVARFYFELTLPMGLCYMVVGAAIIANLVSMFVFPERRRLSDVESMFVLMFDLAQLNLLLYLTGGLTNPFALLIVAPVIISASALPLRMTIILGLTAICFVTGVSLENIPLYFSDGTKLTIPRIFEFGFWLSIVTGILFLGLYSHRVASEIQNMSDALLATQMAFAREQKLTILGGVVAAAAHELGTPLATIKLVSAELMEELSAQPELFEDAQLIRDQANRCRDILQSMGRVGKDDLYLRRAPFGAVIREAAEPHLERGKDVHFEFRSGLGGSDQQPLILRSPEIIHGLRNLIQNAVDFSERSVWIDAEWRRDHMQVTIVDDGPGFALQLLGRIGDPFLRQRRSDVQPSHRPEYEGMGLGLFIAKTLLERSGAELSFANASDPFLTAEERPQRRGAIVNVIWPVETITASGQGPLGENLPFFA